LVSPEGKDESRRTPEYGCEPPGTLGPLVTRDWEWIDTSIPPVARDLKATLGFELRYRSRPDRDTFNFECELTDELRGRWTLSPRADPVDMTVWFAEVLAESWLDQLTSGWPKCPDHPGGAPLEPRRSGDRPIWCCPRTGKEIAEVGSLGNSV